MTTIYDLKKGAMEDFQIWLDTERQGTSDDEVIEAICDIVNGRIPILNHILLRVALSDLRLACSLPDSISADGGNTPCQLIALNIHEYLYGILSDRYLLNVK